MLNPNNLCPGCMSEKVSEGKCPICGYNPSELVNPMYLAPGSVLDGRYVVGKVIDSNGEGITYLGYDTVTLSNVNIREFFPSNLCERDAFDGTVSMIAGNEFNYNDTLVKFLELSKTLFRLNGLPALFDVLDVREANNTAYRITKSVPGISLREFLMRNGGTLKWDQARSLFAPLISSVSALHKAGVIHRGISPDTLIVGKDGKLRINGFLIPEARTAKSVLTSQMFPGFAAVEQYGVAGSQGPWTDIYAFAATIYRTLVGNPPPEATTRLQDDNMTIPAQIARETPNQVLETLANALQVLPDDRTHSIDEMRKGLSVSSVQISTMTGGTSQRTKEKAETYNGYNPQNNKKKKKKGANGVYGIVACIVTVCLLGAITVGILAASGVFDEKTETPSTNKPSNSVVSIGDGETASKIDVDLDEKYTLPNLVGQYFYLAESGQSVLETDKVTIKISAKKYSDEHEAGKIISQVPAPGTSVSVGKTTIEVEVSLGPNKLEINKIVSDQELIGRSAEQVELALLKKGFRYIEVRQDAYNEEMEHGAVVMVESNQDGWVSTDSLIILHTNQYEPPVTENQSPVLYNVE